MEDKTIKNILRHLPENLQTQYLHLWNEYQTNGSDEANFVHQIDKLEMAIQAKIYSRQKNSFKNLLSFFDSSKKEIKDPNLLKLFEQLYDK